MEVNLQPLLDATAPYVGISLPGQRPVVIERRKLERGLGGRVTVEHAEISLRDRRDWDTRPADWNKRAIKRYRETPAQRLLRVFYTHSHGAGKLVLYDQSEHVRYPISDTQQKWAHREYHKRRGNCSDRYCKLNKQTITIASTARERAQLRYAAKLEDGESVEW